jgi:hypothetical protein
MGWLKVRNAPGGLNQRFLGNLIVVSVYSFWEDHYRARIAKQIGLEKEALLIPVLGDVRLIRNDVVHHRGIATERIERCQVLNWFTAGDPIELDADQIDFMMVSIRSSIQSAINPPAA